MRDQLESGGGHDRGDQGRLRPLLRIGAVESCGKNAGKRRSAGPGSGIKCLAERRHGRRGGAGAGGGPRRCGSRPRRRPSSRWALQQADGCPAGPRGRCGRRCRAGRPTAGVRKAATSAGTARARSMASSRRWVRVRLASATPSRAGRSWWTVRPRSRAMLSRDVPGRGAGLAPRAVNLDGIGRGGHGRRLLGGGFWGGNGGGNCTPPRRFLLRATPSLRLQRRLGWPTPPSAAWSGNPASSAPPTPRCAP